MEDWEVTQILQELLRHKSRKEAIGILFKEHKVDIQSIEKVLWKEYIPAKIDGNRLYFKASGIGYIFSHDSADFVDLKPST
jgi:hypothetical protein